MNMMTPLRKKLVFAGIAAKASLTAVSGYYFYNNNDYKCDLFIKYKPNQNATAIPNQNPTPNPTVIDSNNVK
jgi:hypothetical protein